MPDTNREFQFPESADWLVLVKRRITRKELMKRSIAIALSILATLAAPAAALAECTVERDVLDDALKQAPSCAAAYRLFEDCELGASGDVPMGEVVQEKCEADFLGKLDAARKADYRRQLFVCDHKYAKQTGTMYRSFEAFCRAGAARDFANRYGK